MSRGRLGSRVFPGGNPISNCTITNNATTRGTGGIAHGGGSDGVDGITNGAGGYCDLDSIVTINNSIIWGNNVEEIYGIATVNYSNIEGGYSGNNIDSDPLFVNGPLGDYYLSQVAADQLTDSPCVNTGNNTALQSGTTRTDQVEDEGVVDMGYHYTYNIADLNDDGQVNLKDFAILAYQWKKSSIEVLSGDISPEGGDGKVDINDLAVLCENFLW